MTPVDPLLAMEDRVRTEAQVSDASYCDSVLNEAEMLVRHLAAVLVALLPGDTHRDVRYRFEHDLLRASGVGEWARAIQSLVVGNLHSTLVDEAGQAGLDVVQLTQKVDPSDWRHEVVASLRACLTLIGADPPSSRKGSRLLDFFVEFPELRNKMDAHGAPTSSTKASIAAELSPCLEMLRSELSLFEMPLVDVQADLAEGRPVVRAVTVSASQESREVAKANLSASHFSPGLYVVAGDRVRRVVLAAADSDLRDFYYANGAYKAKDGTGEFLSYITGNRCRRVVEDWSAAPTPEAGSETAGLRHLVERRGSYTNAPLVGRSYVERAEVQDELRRAIDDERRFIITLKGRGGVGKTSLALRMVDELCKEGSFDLILWFSARDIDLRQSSSLRVRPEVVSLADVDSRARGLLEEIGYSVEQGESVLGRALNTKEIGRVLWVFDNFETLHDPIEVFSLLDNLVREPHKILITTRHRESRGDFPIEVPGMLRSEFELLVDEECDRLGIGSVAIDRDDLFRISDGHPYVTKVLLGEIREHPRRKPKIALERREDLLESLFERTFDRLGEASRHAFMVLCSWRSDVPQVALEVAINGLEQPPIDVEEAIEQLSLNSLIDLHVVDGETWVHVPFPSWIFGSRKLQTDPRRVDVLLQSEVLQLFGPIDMKRRQSGLTEPAGRFWKTARLQVEGDEWSVWRPRVERLAREVPALWIELGDRYDELGNSTEAIKCYRRLLDVQDSALAWLQLARLYESIGDDSAALNAWVQRALDPTATIDDVSHAANKVNGWIRRTRVALDRQERRLLVEPLIAVMEARLSEATALDCSRLAWLCHNVGDVSAGIRAAERGLVIDPAEEHCQKYVDRYR